MVIKRGILILCTTLLTSNVCGLRICGENGYDCVCSVKNKTIDCNRVFYVIHSYNDDYIPLRTTNLMISSDTKPRAAYFQNNDISALKAGQILPGNEKTLEVLDFSYNGISTIGSNAFEKMENLRVLKLCHNKLTNINKESFFGGPNWNLRELYLNNNPLKNVKNIFGEMPHLEKLVLDEVVGLDLQETFSGFSLTHLKYLSLQNCNITFLPDDIFLDMISLEYLSLSGNPLTTVPQAVQDIPSLKILNLSNTYITEIKTDAFAYDHSLQELYLEENKYLRIIHDCAFCGLPSLQKLILKGCPELSHIHPTAFYSAESKLEMLDVEYANLSTLPSSLNLKTIQTLKLGGNPWNCTCWVAEIKSHHIDFGKGSISPRCQWPASLRGEMLEFVRNTDICSATYRIAQTVCCAIVGLITYSLVLIIIFAIRKFLRLRNGYTRFHNESKHAPEYV